MGAGFWEDTDAESIGLEETAEADKIVAEIQDERDRLTTASDRISSAMTEAQFRFEKASLYRTLLEGSLFEENSGTAELVAEVEGEIKGFVLGRFETLLGMKGESRPAPEAAAPPPFGPDEVEALKFLAGRMIGSSKKAPAAPPQPQLRKAKPAAPAAPAAPAIRRPHRRTLPPTKTVASSEVVSGVAQLAKQQGKRVVVTPDGRIGKVSANREQTRPPAGPGGPRPLPMPSAEEMAAKATVEASQFSQGHALMQIAPVAAQIVKNASKRFEESGLDDNNQ